MIRIWLDDIREAPDATWTVFRNGEALLAYLRAHMGETIHTISFDHDLGDENELDGYDVASFIEAEVAEGHMKAPERMYVHSANPVGAKRLAQCIESIQRMAYE